MYLLYERYTQCKSTYRIIQVNDGEALLCQIKSFLYAKFSDIYKLYKKHLYSKFGYCYVLFDCYGNGPSTKDMQHQNRSGKVSPNITLTSDEKSIKSQDEFLDDRKNKARFIAGLSNHLFQNGFHCVADADATIAKVALEYHSSGKHVVVNADDTDVLCLLIHY